MKFLKVLQRRSHFAGESSVSVPPAGTIQYRIGKHTIALPASHRLPVYQAEHRLYDRFLPFLCATITNSSRWIIDIGANVGDTAYALAQACSNKIACIEAEPSFFNLLRKNLDALPYDKDRFQAHQCLIGTGRFNGVLVKSGSTARVQFSLDNSVKPQFVTLNQFVLNAHLENAEIELIKVDTDGFDSDVLLSGLGVIKRCRPLLFWENQIDNSDQHRSFLALYEELEKLGYRTLWIFDNFGAPVLSDAGFNALRNINDYLAILNRKFSARTFYYVDVLASSEASVECARKAYRDYKDFISRLEARTCSAAV